MGPSETNNALAPGRETIPVGDKYYACAAARLHLIRPLRGHLQLCTPQCEHWGALKGKANGGASSGETCLPAGRSVRGSDTPPACHSAPRTPGGRLEGCATRGEGLGDKKKRPGALLLALFISFCLFIAFWRCRSGPSGTGETGHRRGLRRGRRSWENPWHRRSWYRW